MGQNTDVGTQSARARGADRPVKFVRLLVAVMLATSLWAMTSVATASAAVATTGGASTASATSTLSPTQATVTGTIDTQSPATYRFAYGTRADQLTSSTYTAVYPGGAGPTTVSAVLAGLQDGTTYYYELQVVYTGGLAKGGVRSFTTPTPGPSAPVATTGGATATQGSGTLDPTHATVYGTINTGDPASYRFIYGTRADQLTSSTYSAYYPGASQPGTVSVPISGLQNNTTYYYELVVTYSGGVAEGGVRSFTTPVPQAPPPLATTGGASTHAGTSILDQTSATVSGTINSGGPVSYRFIYGTSSDALNSSTYTAPYQGSTDPGTVSQVLDGLQNDTTYYYELEVITPDGIALGGVNSFTTPSGSSGLLPPL
jgi:hypothetical protein